MRLRLGFRALPVPTTTIRAGTAWTERRQEPPPWYSSRRPATAANTSRERSLEGSVRFARERPAHDAARQGPTHRSRTVSPTAIALILVAAIAHASWNLFSKQACGGGRRALRLAVLHRGRCAVRTGGRHRADGRHPRLSGLPTVFMIGTAIIHIGYALLLQNGYRLGDLSVVYPIGRGSGRCSPRWPASCCSASGPGPLSMAGILLVIAGVVVIGLPGRARQRAAPRAPAPARREGHRVRPAHRHDHRRVHGVGQVRGRRFARPSGGRGLGRDAGRDRGRRPDRAAGRARLARCGTRTGRRCSARPYCPRSPTSWC